MIGAIVIAIIILVVIPVGFLMTTTVVAGIVGCLLTKNAETIHADKREAD